MKLRPLSLLVAATLLTACGEDRVVEQPFAPTVLTLPAMPADSVGTYVQTCATLTGQVTASPNSTLRACGFYYAAEDSLPHRIDCDSASTRFTAVADSLTPGRYWAVAYATNGMGTTRGDTVWFDMP